TTQTSTLPLHDALPILGDEARILSEAQLPRKRMTEDPWADSPVSLILPMKKIKEWGLAIAPKDPNQKFTPPLPKIMAESAFADRSEEHTSELQSRGHLV